MATFAPASANTRAMPLPMPLLPPVTKTERPFNDVVIKISKTKKGQRYHCPYLIRILINLHSPCGQCCYIPLGLLISA